MKKTDKERITDLICAFTLGELIAVQARVKIKTTTLGQVAPSIVDRIKAAGKIEEFDALFDYTGETMASVQAIEALCIGAPGAASEERG